jgi:hypothetical protein
MRARTALRARLPSAKVGHASHGGRLHDRLLAGQAEASSRLRGCTAAGLLVVVLSGCTAVGFHSSAARAQHDFGQPDTVRLCLYLDDGIDEERARALIQEAWQGEGHLFGLHLAVASVTRWSRPAFTVNGILESLQRQPLGPGCDRALALIGRHAGDVLWGLVLPEVLGAVNDETLTHGFAVVQRATVNQLLSSPADVLRHELYHLLGCDAHFRMGRCYEQIARLKRFKQDSRSDFFPAWDLLSQQMLTSREEVNSRLRSVTDPSSITAR